ncbi:hypothetical protein [Rubinisphaera sp.]|uniref:hypothetical protein n=1 Tax=Rubinisphaera sp. TaxID=2024857 RepID=UPI0025DA82E7|nr:hypothetical protein [Rubinisphaera sp.]
MPERSPLVPTHPTWQITRLICFAIILLSVISCVVIAAIRSNGLTQVTVTALDWDNEPRDPIVPFMNPREALPDYELVVIDSSGHKTNLGTRPNNSAVHGLS